MANIPQNPNGQATMANSQPVAIASDQTAVPISAASLPLPTGGSTSALQTTGNTSVASIDTKTPALGQALAAASVPVVLTAAQVTTLTPPTNTGYALDATVGTTNTEIGIVTETAPATDTASSGLNGRLQRVAQRISSLIALLPAALGAGGGLKVDGSGTALPVSGTVTTTPPANASTNVAQVNGVATSTGTGVMGTGVQRVAISSDNDPITIKQATAANLNATIVGTGTFATQSTLAAETTKVIGTVNIAAGQSVTANAGTNLNTSALALDATLGTTNTEIGIVTETAPATDTASSGLNGRLQRIAQRLTSLIALLPTALGQGTMATSMKVVLPSDQSAIPVTLTSTTVTGTVSENLAQVNGVTVLTGTGATGTGSQRVTVAVDSATVAGSASLPAGTNLIGKTGIDQTTPGTTNAVSVAQIGATTVTTGVGASTAGTQRIVTATDSTIGTVTAVTSITNNVNVVGTKTNNNVAPGATNVGALGALANAAIPAWTEGNLVASSVDLSGNTRVIQPDLVVAATNITTVNLNLFSGVATANSTVASGTLNGVATGVFQVTGTYSGLLIPQGTTDGTNWVTLTGIRKIGATSVLITLPNGDTGIYRINTSGFTKWRVTASNTITGTATVTLESSAAPSTIAVVNSVLLDPSTAPSISVSGGNNSASVFNQAENSLLEQILAQLQAQNDSLGISPAGSNANLRRTLDNNFNEIVTLHNDRSRIKTANITISASTAETTLINADFNNYVDILAVVVNNTSTATATRVDFRDSTGGNIIFPVYSNGGANPSGFSLGGMAIPQTMIGKNWTAQCSISTTDIRIFVLYSLKSN